MILIWSKEKKSLGFPFAISNSTLEIKKLIFFLLLYLCQGKGLRFNEWNYSSKHQFSAIFQFYWMYFAYPHVLFVHILSFTFYEERNQKLFYQMQIFVIFWDHKKREKITERLHQYVIYETVTSRKNFLIHAHVDILKCNIFTVTLKAINRVNIVAIRSVIMTHILKELRRSVYIIS